MGCTRRPPLDGGRTIARPHSRSVRGGELREIARTFLGPILVRLLPRENLRRPTALRDLRSEPGQNARSRPRRQEIAGGQVPHCGLGRFEEPVEDVSIARHEDANGWPVRLMALRPALAAPRNALRRSCETFSTASGNRASTVDGEAQG